MKVERHFIVELIESDNPVEVIGNKLLELWLSVAEKENNIENYYYKGEEKVKDFEEFILKSYWEFYDLLAEACLEEKNVFQLYPDTAILIMDGMSIRESVLLYNLLKNKVYNIKHKFNYSALPSDTEFFREKIKKSINDFAQINNHTNIRLTGKEKFIWSFFPDVMLDKIQIGRTVISSLEEMYDKTKNIVLEILEKIRVERIVITSDHGYIMAAAGLVFSVPDMVKKKLQEIFGGKRYVEINDVNVEDLINEGYVKKFNGYYLAKSRYLWPVRGKYSIYIHGGLSLMECYTPVLEVEK